MRDDGGVEEARSGGSLDGSLDGVHRVHERARAGGARSVRPRVPVPEMFATHATVPRVPHGSRTTAEAVPRRGIDETRGAAPGRDGSRGSVGAKRAGARSVYRLDKTTATAAIKFYPLPRLILAAPRPSPLATERAHCIPPPPPEYA